MLTEFIRLASRKAPRGLARLADNAVVQSDVAPIEVTDRARVRLACTNAIQGAGRPTAKQLGSMSGAPSFRSSLGQL